MGHAGQRLDDERDEQVLDLTAPWLGGGPVGPEAHGWTPVAPSPLPFDDGHPVPHELTVDEIQGIVGRFREAARRAVDAGFEVAEVHGAHGYLIGQFLSPHSNRRTDEFGGSFENRVRFALQVVDAVREVWPQELPVLFRISATDWLTENDEDEREGWTVDETVRLAEELKAHGVDLLDVSSGGNAPRARIETGPGYQVPFAERVRAETSLPVAAVGLITDPQQAEKVITEGRADAVLLGRELLRSPSWAQYAARELGGEVRTPEQYLRAV
ncbi:tRNA-dihydrouridine synthase [Streptomyces sp. NBC_01618]|nr:tRNA-dihydrouridine synthase [Streptomyces sp. NBC_01618]